MNHMVQLMKQLSGKVGSSIYSSVSNQGNPHHVSFLRQMEKEVKQQKDVLEQPLDKLNVIVFDLETTGFYPDQGDKVLSIGAVKVNGDVIDECDCFYSLVHANVNVDPRISELTGITTADLKTAPSLQQVLGEFYRYIEGQVLVAHHANHEKSFMQHATWSVRRKNFQHRIIDTSFLTRLFQTSERLVSLDECCSYFGIATNGRHHALHDAKMTAELWRASVKKVQDLGYQTLNDIYVQLAKMR
ncbi:3'-5' exoribonuclease [Desertibacillus haloalkaliphilus]|nr:3'-5' exoribonuclease [Desertibacillus haloalkaliphilus]